MRPFSTALIRKKIKSILYAIIVIIVISTILHLHVFRSDLQMNNILQFKNYHLKVTTGDNTSDKTGEKLLAVTKTTELTNLPNSNNTHSHFNSSKLKHMQLQIASKDVATIRDDSKVVFFIGGGKSGSTTLATYLKHDPNNWDVWDPHGQFMDCPKELCWSMTTSTKERFWHHYQTHGSKTATFALDACPRAVERFHFARMVSAFPNASYLMLVRDPVDRVISHVNDMMDRGHAKGTVDELIKRSLPGNQLVISLSMFGKILQTAYDVLPRNKILIIPNSDLKRQPQQTIDKVMKHIGAQPKNVTLVEANKRNNKSFYQIPSNSTINLLRNLFYKDWELFKNLSGLDIETVYM